MIVRHQAYPSFLGPPPAKRAVAKSPGLHFPTGETGTWRLSETAHMRSQPRPGSPLALGKRRLLIVTLGFPPLPQEWPKLPWAPAHS